jgi:hypothetical protein
VPVEPPEDAVGAELSDDEQPASVAAMGSAANPTAKVIRRKFVMVISADLKKRLAQCSSPEV